MGGGNFGFSGGALSSNSSFDNEIVNNLAKQGITRESVKRQLNDGDSYMTGQYM